MPHLRRALTPQVGSDEPQIPTQPECYPLLTMIHLDLQPEVEAQLDAEAHAPRHPLNRDLQQIVASSSEAMERRLLDQAGDPGEGIRQVSNSFIVAKSGTRGTPVAPQRYIRPISRQAGITKNIGWYTLRHSFGTFLAI